MNSLRILSLGTKIYTLDDISAYLTQIIRYIIDIVVYARDGTSDRLTPQLTLQFMQSLTLTSGYHKLNLDRESLMAYHTMLQELYEQNKSSPVFGRDIEAR